MSKKLLLIILVLAAGIILFTLTALVLTPADLIEGALKNAVARQTGLELRSDPFKRVFPFGIEATGLTVERPAGKASPALLAVDKLSIRLHPMSLFAGRIRTSFKGTVANGALSGAAVIKPGGLYADIRADGIGQDAVPALAGAGFTVKGSVTGRAEVGLRPGKCAEGTVRAKGLDIESGGLRVMGFRLPFGDIADSGIDIELMARGGQGCAAHLKGLWIDGRGLSARLSGLVYLRAPLDSSPLDLVLEVIPKGGTVEELKGLFFLAPYRKSANYYSIDVKGTVSKPRI